MKLTQAHSRLLAMNQPFTTTADAAAVLGISPEHASQILARLAEDEHLLPLRRGLWAFREKAKTFAVPSYLTAPLPSYVSLQTALYYHGLISQMPSVTYAVSLGRTRSYETPLGTVSIHHVDPSFFFGFEPVGDQGAQLAVPEKALLDVLYLSSAKTHLFSALPEVEIPERFSEHRARQMIHRIRSDRLRTIVTAGLERVLKSASVA